MTVVLDLEPELEEALKRQAASKGSPVTSYVKTLIQMQVNLGPTLRGNYGSRMEELRRFGYDRRRT